MTDYKYHRYMLFKDPEGAIQRWRLLKMSFGEFESCESKEIGYINERFLGMAVFNGSGCFQKLVSVGDFSAAINFLGVDDCLMVSNSHTEFSDWLMARETEYWDASESAESVIHDFLNDRRGDILGDQKDPEVKVDKLMDDFDRDIMGRIDDIDESRAHNWLSFAYGWALAKGMDVYSAQDFAIRIDDLRRDTGKE